MTVAERPTVNSSPAGVRRCRVVDSRLETSHATGGKAVVLFDFEVVGTGFKFSSLFDLGSGGGVYSLGELLKAVGHTGVLSDTEQLHGRSFDALVDVTFKPMETEG